MSLMLPQTSKMKIGTVSYRKKNWKLSKRRNVNVRRRSSLGARLRRTPDARGSLYKGMKKRAAGRQNAIRDTMSLTMKASCLRQSLKMTVKRNGVKSKFEIF